MTKNNEATIEKRLHAAIESGLISIQINRGDDLNEYGEIEHRWVAALLTIAGIGEYSCDPTEYLHGESDWAAIRDDLSAEDVNRLNLGWLLDARRTDYPDDVRLNPDVLAWLLRWADDAQRDADKEVEQIIEAREAEREADLRVDYAEAYLDAVNLSRNCGRACLVVADSDGRRVTGYYAEHQDTWTRRRRSGDIEADFAVAEAEEENLGEIETWDRDEDGDYDSDPDGRNVAEFINMGWADDRDSISVD